jgi:hypothetical protein
VRVQEAALLASALAAHRPTIAATTITMARCSRKFSRADDTQCP